MSKNKTNPASVREEKNGSANDDQNFRISKSKLKFPLASGVKGHSKPGQLFHRKEWKKHCG